MVMQPLLDDYFCDTSVKAFNIKSDELVSDRQRVLDEIRNNPITCKELAIRWGCSSNDISGRFTELSKEGIIVCIGIRLLPNRKGRMYPHKIWEAVY